MLFTWFMLAGFILLIAPENWTKKLQPDFSYIFRWPWRIGGSLSLFATYPALRDTVNYKEYNNHIANLTKWLEQERKSVEELQVLRKRFPLEDVKFLSAYVSPSSAGTQSELYINCGRKHGLARGQFVLGSNSIIGTVQDVWSHSAQVRLITDPASKIAVEILGVRRLMNGNGNNSAKIPHLLKDKHKVKIGDYVFAAPTRGFLNAPMVTGKIVECQRDDENPSLWDITVKPVCDIERLNSVIVMIMNP